jgi:hypothetical protein
MPSWTLIWRIVSVSILVVSIGAGNVEPARALPDPPTAVTAPTRATSDQPLEILDQSIWVTPGEAVRIQVRVTTTLAPAQQSLALVIYPRLRNLDDYDRAIADNVRGSALGLSVARLDQLVGTPTGEGTTYTLELATQGPGENADRTKLALSVAGVYPMRIELRNDDGVAFDRRVSFVMSTGRETPTGVATQLTIPLTRSASSLEMLLSPATTDSSTQGDPQNTALNERIAVLGKHPNTPFSLLLGGAAIDGLGETDPKSLTDLVAYLSVQPVTTQFGPYVDIAPELYSSPNYDTELATQVATTAAAAKSLVALTDDQSPAINNSTYDTAPSGVRTNSVITINNPSRPIVVDDRELVVTNQSGTKSRNPPLDLVRQPLVTLTLSDGQTRPAIIANGRAREAQRTQAESVVLVARTIGALVQPALITPSRTDIPAAGLALSIDGATDARTLDRLLKELSGSPWIALTTDLQAAIADSQSQSTSSLPSVELTRDQELRTQGRADPVLIAGNTIAQPIISVRKSQTAFAAFSDRHQPTTQQTDRLLLWSAARDINAETRLGLLDETATQIQTEFSAISLPPDRPVRLSARTGAIPITVQSSAQYDTQVLIRIRSTQLQFPEGNERLVTVSKDNRTETFQVVARGSGAFPLNVEVLTPDGSQILAQSETVIRSTAASGVGIALSGAALLVLAFWWGRQVFRGRRRSAGQDSDSQVDVDVGAETPTSPR